MARRSQRLVVHQARQDIRDIWTCGRGRRICPERPIRADYVFRQGGVQRLSEIELASSSRLFEPVHLPFPNKCSLASNSGGTAMDFLTTLLQTIAFVPSLVNGIEGLFSHKSGTEKKDAALSFLRTALSMSNAVANRQIVDQQKFRDGMGKVIDGVVECLNASVWAKSK